MADVLAQLRKRISRAPQEPGIYRWKDAEGNVLYVGKAKNLRNRLRSYVQKNAGAAAGPWRRSFYRQLADFDVTVTNTELEALVLETNLIKQLRPKYNVLMKDDKNYVYVEVTVQDPFPRINVERRMADPKAKYFGPFLSAWETRQTLEMLDEIFRFRACKESIDALNRAGDATEAVYNTGKLRPCLDYQIGRCCGTCAGMIGKDEYRDRVNQVLHFLRGDYKPVLEKGHALMLEAASQKKFERAAKLRDMLGIIESLQERQLVSDTSGENADIVGVALLSAKVQVVVFHKRGGKLVGEKHMQLTGAAESVADALDQFLPQFYSDVADLPDGVILGEEIPDRAALEAFLSERKGKKVRVIVPSRGSKTKLLELAEKNAHEKAKQAEASWEADRRNTEQALEELAGLLHLPSPPQRIEGYDISHTGGSETVGSMVVTVNGKPKNEHYRSFTIRTMQRGVVDDYRALQEVLSRRLRHIAGGLQAEEERWMEAGTEIGRARKEEQAAIREIVGRHPDQLSDVDVTYDQFLVARHEGEIIGFVRLRPHPGKLLELASLWVDDAYQTRKLAQFLARKILRSVKQGKVYVRVPSDLEQYYAGIGFRHVLKPPRLLKEGMGADPDRIVMMYDVAQNKADASLSAVPDLLVIDGGKGQLNAVLEVLKELELAIPVIGLAKREEEVFVPEQGFPVLFPKDSPAKFLLMRLRDEAHRFANRHRERRMHKRMLETGK